MKIHSVTTVNKNKLGYEFTCGVSDPNLVVGDQVIVFRSYDTAPYGIAELIERDDNRGFKMKIVWVF